jgi:hypothetical protein
MCLETLKGINEIGGFKVYHLDAEKIMNKQDSDYNNEHVVVDHAINTLHFSLQNGPIKEVGENGCQIDTVIEAAKLVIEGLNERYPCEENHMAIVGLNSALSWLKLRKENREKRGVEGTNAV